MLAGLDFPTKGEIVVNDTPVTGPGPDRGMVFQSYTLFPWMNVEDNIKFGLRIKKLPKDEQQRIADRYLDIIGLRKGISKGIIWWYEAESCYSQSPC